MQCQYCHFEFEVGSHYSRHLQVPHGIESVATGSTEPAEDVQEFASIRSHSQTVMAVSGNRIKTHIERSLAMERASMEKTPAEVLFSQSNVDISIGGTQELVSGTGGLQESPQSVTSENSLVSTTHKNICPRKWISELDTDVHSYSPL